MWIRDAGHSSGTETRLFDQMYKLGSSDFPMWREFESISPSQHLCFGFVWNLVFSRTVSFCEIFIQDFLKNISM